MEPPLVPTTLQNLAEFNGSSAVVRELQIPELDAVRLQSLGVFVGQTISVRRAAAAVIISAAGGRLAVSKDVARQIIVQNQISPLAESA